ncbi:MAG: hypothetical protein IPL78_28310 [Chloroflexi bacterium]|nr:hypothetical protein [Chloroflexota bacterium]
MLDHLRQRVIETLATVRSATLSTYGPAELQATLLSCEAVDMHLYLLLPATSDHVLNLENQPEAVVTTSDWQLRGLALILDSADYPPDLSLYRKPEAQWSRLVEIRPTQLHIRRRHGWGYSETIDVEG